MFQMISMVMSLVSIVLLFVSPKASMIPLGIIDVIIILQYNIARSKYKFNNIPNLSPEANSMLKEYSHYFAMPFASKDFSASAATSQFAGIILMIFALFRKYWLVIPFAIINWFVMGKFAIGLSPASLIAQSSSHRRSHDEIVEFFRSQNKYKDF